MLVLSGGRLKSYCLALACLALAWACGRSGAEPSAAATGPLAPAGLTHVRVDGPIDVGAQALISRAIRSAHAAGHNTLLLDIDTPGGAIDVMWQIQKQLLEAERDGLELACWIHQHATSAGALLALTCKRVYIASAGTIGSAMPVTFGPAGMQALPEEGGVREKELSFLRSQFASIAEKRGRPAALAMAMVDPQVEVRQIRRAGELELITGDEWDALRAAGDQAESVAVIVARGRLLNLTAQQAVELRFADGQADTLAQVIDKLGLAADVPISERLERTRSETIVAWLDQLGWLLLIAGLALAYTELKLPGFGIPGILSIVCFALLLTGKYLAGLADVPHIVAVAVGALLIAVEVFVLPGTLWVGIAGAILLVGGLVFASLGPGFELADPLNQSMLLDSAFSVLGSAGAALLLMLLLSRVLPKTPILRRIVLTPGAAAAFAGALPESSHLPRLGAAGRARTDLRPVGKVVLDGHGEYEFEARAVGAALERGTRVRVIEVDAARLVVEPVQSESA